MGRGKHIFTSTSVLAQWVSQIFLYYTLHQKPSGWPQNSIYSLVYGSAGWLNWFWLFNWLRLGLTPARQHSKLLLGLSRFYLSHVRYLSEKAVPVNAFKTEDLLTSPCQSNSHGQTRSWGQKTHFTHMDGLFKVRWQRVWQRGVKNPWHISDLAHSEIKLSKWEQQSNGGITAHTKFKTTELCRNVSFEMYLKIIFRMGVLQWALIISNDVFYHKNYIKSCVIFNHCVSPWDFINLFLNQQRSGCHCKGSQTTKHSSHQLDQPFSTIPHAKIEGLVQTDWRMQSCSPNMS